MNEKSSWSKALPLLKRYVEKGRVMLESEEFCPGSCVQSRKALWERLLAMEPLGTPEGKLAGIVREKLDEAVQLDDLIMERLLARKKDIASELACARKGRRTLTAYSQNRATGGVLVDYRH